MPIDPGITQAAAIANQAFQSSQNRKVDQSGLNLQQQENYEKAQIERAKLSLDQQKSEMGAQSDAYRKAIIGALGSGNMKDVGYTKEGGFSGGLRPSAIGASGQAASSLLGSQAMDQLAHPQARPELAAYQRFKIGDQQAYEDPSIGKKAGFWAKAGYLANPFKWDNLKNSMDPDYRKPGSHTALAQPGPLDPKAQY